MTTISNDQSEIRRIDQALAEVPDSAKMASTNANQEPFRPSISPEPGAGLQTGARSLADLATNERAEVESKSSSVVETMGMSVALVEARGGAGTRP